MSIILDRNKVEQGSISINGRSYSVQLHTEGNDCYYILRGSRGSLYRTMRNTQNPTSMFLISSSNRGGKCVTGHALARVWLSDNNGELKVL